MEAHTEELELNEASPLVRELRRRKARAKKKWAKLDQILE
jgi:hypothetical protein